MKRKSGKVGCFEPHSPIKGDQAEAEGAANQARGDLSRVFSNRWAENRSAMPVFFLRLSRVRLRIAWIRGLER